MILEDFIMLGTTVPDPSKKDDRMFVCSAGVSLELKEMVRIYPLAMKNVPNRWHKYQIRVERNPQDQRKESWQIAGDRSEDSHRTINENFIEVGEATDSEKELICSKFLISSIAEANEKRLSLAVVQPIGAPTLEFCPNNKSPYSPQMSLFDGGEQIKKGSKRFPYIPKLKFYDADGCHSLSIRDWGVFEFMRKWGEYRYNEIGEILKLQHSPLLLVGNQANYRNSWLIISVFSPNIGKQNDLFCE